MASGFDVSALSAYTEENRFDLMRATVLGAKMMDLATVVPNVKGPQKLPQIAQTVFFQSDGCSFNASGGTAITQRSMTPGKIKVNDAWCPKDLEPIYLVQEMAAGAHKEEVEPSFVWEAIMLEYAEKIAAANDVAIWQGDTSTGTGNNQFYNGFIDTIGAGYTDANTGGTPLTTLYTEAAAKELVERIYRTASSAGLTADNDGCLFVGYDTYSWIFQGLVNGGSTNGVQLNSGANGDADADASIGLVYPGFNLKIVPVQGLDGQEKAYYGKKSNMFIGVDAEGDFDNFEVWYSKDDRNVKLAVEFKVGTQVAFPAEIVAIVI
jgi:hypothetical protein